MAGSSSRIRCKPTYNNNEPVEHPQEQDNNDNTPHHEPLQQPDQPQEQVTNSHVPHNEPPKPDHDNDTHDNDAQVSMNEPNALPHPMEQDFDHYGLPKLEIKASVMEESFNDPFAFAISNHLLTPNV